jgi:hypothetical protein
MKRIALVAALLAGTLIWAQAKPTTIRIVGEDVVAQIEFERGVKMSLSSKPSPIKPDTYWTQSLSLFKKDDKGRAWELRGNGVFGSLANVTVEAEQDKVLLLGKPVAVVVEAKPAEDPAGTKVLAVSVAVRGLSSETFFPGAFADGRQMTMPNVTIKDEAGKTLASGRCEMREKRYAWFAWRYPAGFKAKYDVDVEVFMGPFEFKPTKTIEAIEKP